MGAMAWPGLFLCPSPSSSSLPTCEEYPLLHTPTPMVSCPSARGQAFMDGAL